MTRPLAVRGGSVLTPRGWGDLDLLLSGTRIVSGATDVRRGGETFDGVGPHTEGDSGGAGAARETRFGAVERDAVTAARPDNLAAGGTRPGAGSDGPGSGADGPGGGVGVDVLDARGLWVVPGLVDLQCNGGWGIDLATAPERMWELAALLPRTGVTAWLPTIVTGPPDVRRRALAALAAGPPAELAGVPVATPLGLHLEGPFLAPERRGAHPPAWVRTADPDGPRTVEDEGWSRAAGVALVTLAPERPGGLDLVRALAGRGVVVSAGHSSATADEAEAAVGAGVRWVTHLFNAMAPLHHRDPGLVGVALADDRLHVGLIADGLHVDPRVVRTAARALGDRLTLVTDAVAALGLPHGPVTLGRTPVHSGPDGVRLPDGTLAGSALSLDQAVRNLVAYGLPDGLPDGGGTSAAAGAVALADAVRAASTHPARLLGDPDRGTLTTGARADLVLLDDAGEVVATVVGGHVAHDRRAAAAPGLARGGRGRSRDGRRAS